jgi:hypothetical protein
VENTQNLCWEYAYIPHSEEGTVGYASQQTLTSRWKLKNILDRLQMMTVFGILAVVL